MTQTTPQPSKPTTTTCCRCCSKSVKSSSLTLVPHPATRSTPSYAPAASPADPAGRVEPEAVEPAAQRIPQVSHPGVDDLKWAARFRAVVQPQIQLALPGGQPLPRHRGQYRKLRVVVRGPDVLDIARAPVGGVHD